MAARVAVTIVLLTVMGCTNGSPETEQSSQELLPALGGDDDDTDEAADGEDAALRRNYRPNEMRRHECVKLHPDGALVGSNCPSGCVLFGPYLTAPGNADVHVSFDIEPTNTLRFRSDVVSARGKTYHGLMDEVEVGGAGKQKVGYQIHFFQPADNIEGRVWVQGEEPSNFRITNFSLEVR